MATVVSKYIILIMKKNIFLWALYDLANTPLTVAITGLYLAQWVVLDNNLPDIWYGGTFVLATLLLLLSSPFWGAWSDNLGQRMPFLKWTTFTMIVVGIVMGIIAPSSLPTMPKVITVLFLFLIIQYTYQISLIFYDSLLLELSNNKNRGKISGIGRTFGELGWLIGPAVLLPFATGQITLFGTPGRSQVFLPAIILLIFLGLPMILWFKEKKTKQLKDSTNIKQVYFKTISGLKDLIKKDKNVSIYLLSFMLISDALLTALLYFGIFLDQIYKINDTEKVVLLMILEIAAVFSAFSFGKLSDKYGTKNLLILSCILMAISYFLIAASSSLIVLYIITPLIGVGMGGFYPTARTMLIQISPEDKLGEYFGFYATFEKFASIIGPLIWGITTLILRDYGVIKYRIALLFLVVLMVIGIYLLKFIKEGTQEVNLDMV